MKIKAPEYLVLLGICAHFSYVLCANIDNANELQAAINHAHPGDTITLKPITYNGEFHLTNHGGGNSNPITITGSSENRKSSVIITDRTAFHIGGHNWIIKDLTVKNAAVGVNIQGNGNHILAVSCIDTKEGLIIDGDNNVVKDSYFKSTEMGINIYRGQENKIESSAFSRSSRNTSLHIDQLTCCGSLNSNNFKGLVTIDGDSYKIKANTFEGGIRIQGCHNELSQNYYKWANITEKCANPTDNSNSFHSSAQKVYIIGVVLFVFLFLGQLF